MISEGHMKSRLLNANKRIVTIVLILAGLCCVLPMMSMAQAQAAATAAASGPKGFDNPQQLRPRRSSKRPVTITCQIVGDSRSRR